MSNNTYVALYGGHKVTVDAPTSYAAQTAAVDKFQAMFRRRKIKSYQIAVMLAAKNGEPVTHNPAAV